MLDIVKSGSESVPLFIKLKHFNKDYPENHNVLYDETLKHCKIKESNDNWIHMNTDNVSEPKILTIADLEMNLDEKRVRRSGKIIDLTAKEFGLLEYLLRNKNKMVSRTEIAEKVWDIHFDTGTNVIDVYVNFLRKKIDKEFTPKLIHTMVGMGYILREEDK